MGSEHALPAAVASAPGRTAMANLQAQIDSLAARAAAGQLAVAGFAEWIGLTTLRGQLLGRVSDSAWALRTAGGLVFGHPNDGLAHLTRARARTRLHLFHGALADLSTARSLGADPDALDGERAAVWQATGRYDEALGLLRAAHMRRPNAGTFGALAVLQAERGDVADAEDLFAESRAADPAASPITLARLDVQRGLMWLRAGEVAAAHGWFASAAALVPDFAAAQSHLAETEAALGNPEAAAMRLLPLAGTAEDPVFSAALARGLAQLGRDAEAAAWQAEAARRYTALMQQHPEAFAEPAATFWLDAGDPNQAVRLARINLGVQRTPRAEALLARAALAAAAQWLERRGG